MGAVTAGSVLIDTKNQHFHTDDEERQIKMKLRRTNKHLKSFDLLDHPGYMTHLKDFREYL